MPTKNPTKPKRQNWKALANHREGALVVMADVNRAQSEKINKLLQDKHKFLVEIVRLKEALANTEKHNAALLAGRSDLASCCICGRQWPRSNYSRALCDDATCIAATVSAFPKPPGSMQPVTFSRLEAAVGAKPTRWQRFKRFLASMGKIKTGSTI